MQSPWTYFNTIFYFTLLKNLIYQQIIKIHTKRPQLLLDTILSQIYYLPLEFEQTCQYVVFLLMECSKFRKLCGLDIDEFYF